MERFDLIVIGGGAGGLTAASGAVAFGAKTALIHDRPLGGDCLWTGCVPSKALLNAAELVHAAKKAAEFGFEQTKPLSFAKIRQRVQQAIDTIQQHDDPAWFRERGVELIEGKGSFVDAHTIEVDGKRRITGDRIIVATGSRPIIPSIPGLREAGFVTNETFLSMSDLPERWLVIGAGPIGLEFGQALSRFGCRVTIVEQGNRLLPNYDSETVDILARALRREGIRLLTSASIEEIAEARGEIRVRLRSEGERYSIEADRIFVAAGRRPNTKSLNADRAGVQLDERGAIAVDETMRTNVPHIYAVGDANGRMPFTHVANAEAKIALAGALFGARRKMDYASTPMVIYTDPELYQLGETEERLSRRAASRTRTYRLSLADVDRFIVDSETLGLIKIAADRKGNIVTASAVGKRVSDAMQEVVLAKRLGRSIGDLSQAIHPYPARVTAVQQTADLYWREKLFSGRANRWLQTYARWLRKWRKRRGKP